MKANYNKKIFKKRRAPATLFVTSIINSKYLSSGNYPPAALLLPTCG